MHIAMGYRWYPTSAGYHIERALSSLGHTVQYVGLSSAMRPGYDSSVMLQNIIDSFHQTPAFYLWVDSAGRYFPFGIEDLAIPTACYLIDVHLGTWRYEVAKFFDIVFIAQKDYVDRFRNILGHDQVHWLPLAAASDFHEHQDLLRIYDVGFVGNVSRAHQSTPRVRQLRRLANTFKTNEFFTSYSPQEVGQVYSQSKIVFNTSIAGDVTMRIFEGTMGGALVMTDSEKNGLGKLFHVGKEIVVYSTENDLFDKLLYYLSHNHERDSIAISGQKRTITEHTYHHRAEKIIHHLGSSHLKNLAPMRGTSSQERAKSRHTVYTHLHMVDTILDIAQEQRVAPFGRFMMVLPAFGRRLLI